MWHVSISWLDKHRLYKQVSNVNIWESKYKILFLRMFSTCSCGPILLLSKLMETLLGPSNYSTYFQEDSCQLFIVTRSVIQISGSAEAKSRQICSQEIYGNIYPKTVWIKERDRHLHQQPPPSACRLGWGHCVWKWKLGRTSRETFVARQKTGWAKRK